MSKVFTIWKIQGKLLIIAEEDDLHSLLQAGADVESTEHCKKRKSTKNLVARLKEIRPWSFQPMGAGGLLFGDSILASCQWAPFPLDTKVS